MSLKSGQKLGPFEIIEKAGAGGMGEAYRANDTRLDRTVAIIILPANQDMYTDERFQHFLEVNNSSNVNNLVRSVVVDVLKHQGKADQSDDITVLSFFTAMFLPCAATSLSRMAMLQPCLCP